MWVIKGYKKLFVENCHILLTVGTIISWVNKPNKGGPSKQDFDDDTWIECNGQELCKSGSFEGQFCADLSDRVLVGAGKLGDLLDLKDASLPNHAHNHAHDGLTNGTQTYNIKYRTGEKYYHDSGKALGWGDGSMGKKHNHDQDVTTTLKIDFGKMNPSEALISKIENPKVSVSSAENELYSPHMRVRFYFKCL